jgi:predicted DNA-binding transcriptional regulator AlpA
MDQRHVPADAYFLLTSKQVCRMLCISSRTLYYWLSKHKFPQPLRIGPNGRVLRWHPDDLLQYLQRTRGQVASTSASHNSPVLPNPEHRHVNP